MNFGSSKHNTAKKKRTYQKTHGQGQTENGYVECLHNFILSTVYWVVVHIKVLFMLLLSVRMATSIENSQRHQARQKTAN